MDNIVAIANIGVKPTVSDHHIPLLEIHIPNFHENLYGKKLRIAFDAFIRPEMKFSSIEILKAQIEKDIKVIA
jgi:riboflavin kinase/FMN adenylyltransferase